MRFVHLLPQFTVRCTDISFKRDVLNFDARIFINGNHEFFTVYPFFIFGSDNRSFDVEVAFFTVIFIDARFHVRQIAFRNNRAFRNEPIDDGVQIVVLTFFCAFITVSRNVRTFFQTDFKENNVTDGFFLDDFHVFKKPQFVQRFNRFRHIRTGKLDFAANFQARNARNRNFIRVLRTHNIDAAHFIFLWRAVRHRRKCIIGEKCLRQNGFGSA